MNKNVIILLDFETGSRNPFRTQPTQLAALAIDGRKLEVLSSFNSEICPILDDEKAKKVGLDPLENDALKITRKTREQLATAPQLKVVWDSFVEWVGKYNIGNGLWDKPVVAGFNIVNFDLPIIYRLCQKYGPFDKDELKPKLFHPINIIDIMTDVFRMTENNPGIRSISLDSSREMLGMSKENAHDALCDVVDSAEIMIRFMKLYRGIASKVKFEGSCTSRLIDINNIKNL